MMDKTTPTATPRGLRPLTVMVLAALWIATIGNLALWRALAALPELGNARGWLFGLAFALLIGAVQVAISSLFAWRWSLKPVLAFMLLAAAAGAYFMLSYGVVIERTMMVNVLLTDTREARELLSWRMAGALALLGVLPVALLWRARMSWPSGLRQLRNNALTLVAALALAIVAMGLSFQDLSATMRNHTQLRYLINPLNSFYAIATLGERPIQRNGAAVLPIGQDAHLAPRPAGAHPPLVLLVVGETARSDHQGLNGYARDTNPAPAKTEGK